MSRFLERSRSCAPAACRAGDRPLNATEALAFLPPEARATLAELGPVDVVIGIPSYHNERTIGHVARAVSYGLAKYFPELKAVVLDSDGGSRDRTREVFLNGSIEADLPTLLRSPLRPPPRVAFTYAGPSGKGSALRAVFAAVVALQARAGIVVDADLRSIMPEWVELLGWPVLEGGFDFVTPYYLRHKYDGTITNMSVYPLTRALYGRRVRQPIGGDFGFSARLAQRYLEDPAWDTDVARFGVDIFMTTVALAEDFKVCQASLGLKIHDAKDPATSLGPMFVQVLNTLFALMRRYQQVWTKVQGSRSVPLYGFPFAHVPATVKVSFERLVERFRDGLAEHKRTLAAALPAERLATLEALAHQQPTRGFTFPEEAWAATLYDVAVAHATLPAEERQRLLQALIPLYFGRTAAFVAHTRRWRSARAEALVEAQCEACERLKPYLIRRWRSAQAPA